VPEHGLLVGLGGVERGGYAATAKDDNAMGQRKDFRQFGGDEQDALAGTGQFLNQGVDLGFCTDVDAAGRFVEDDEVRVAKQAAGEEGLLLITSAELGDGLGRTAGLDG
jgi:hypothetical protein